MRKRTITFVLSISLLLVLVVTASAITWGETDGYEHPYVGILYFEQPSGIYRCTGTLLSPTVMLTAGHCTEEGGVANYHSWVSFEPEITFPADLDIYDDNAFKAYLDKNFIKGVAIPHPKYDDFSEFPNTYDVGVVLLQKRVRLNEYGQLPELGLLETLLRGQDPSDRLFTVVGYGLQGYIPPAYSAVRARYQGTVRLIELNSANNGDQQGAKFTNNPGGGNGSGGTCFGDSGGPVFYADTNIVGAVVSWGITPCIGVDYQFRVDTPVAQDFVQKYLPKH